MNPPREEPASREYSTAAGVSLGISLVIMGVVVGLVIWYWLNPTDNPARFLIKTGQTRIEENLFYVDFTIENKGDETGENVKVEGTITVDGREEKASTIFEFVPGRSEEQGVLVFGHEPLDLVVTIESYQKP